MDLGIAFQQIPVDNLVSIFRRMPLPALTRASRSCKELRNFITDHRKSLKSKSDCKLLIAQNQAGNVEFKIFGQTSPIENPFTDISHMHFALIGLYAVYTLCPENGCTNVCEEQPLTCLRRALHLVNLSCNLLDLYGHFEGGLESKSDLLPLIQFKSTRVVEMTETVIERMPDSCKQFVTPKVLSPPSFAVLSRFPSVTILAYSDKSRNQSSLADYIRNIGRFEGHLDVHWVLPSDSDRSAVYQLDVANLIKIFEDKRFYIDGKMAVYVMQLGDGRLLMVRLNPDLIRSFCTLDIVAGMPSVIGWLLAELEKNKPVGEDEQRKLRRPLSELAPILSGLPLGRYLETIQEFINDIQEAPV